MLAFCEFDSCFFGNELGHAVLTLVSALIGALAGLFLLQFVKAFWISHRLKLYVTRHEFWTNLRIWNGSSFSMKDTVVYISIKHGRLDIVPGNSYINPGSAAVQVIEDRISWSLAIGNKHGPKIDIHPHERQVASFFWSDINRIQIPSETGLDSPRSRVVLKRKPYDCLVKVVATDMRQAAWEVTIDPNRVAQASKLSLKTYESKLIKYQADWV